MINKKKNIVSYKRFLELLILFNLGLSLPSFAGTDTTKSETRLVERESEKKEDSSQKNERRKHRDSFLDEKDADDGCNFFDALFVGFFKFVLIEPVKVFFNTDLAVYNFSEKKVKWGPGASLFDFSYYPKASFSYSLKLNGHFLFIPNEYIAIREHIGFHLSPLGGFLSDFERDVYVNGTTIGTEIDKGDSYYNFSFPFSTEVMFKPAGDKGSFFFLLGAGPRYVYEKFKGNREYSYRVSKDSLVVSDGNWIPSLSFGIGKLIEAGNSFASFEIRYSLGINHNSRKKSLPGDNSKFVHGFTLIEYQIFF